jgi:hypothetical protein
MKFTTPPQALLFCSLMVLVGCGGGSSTVPADPPPAVLVLSPASATLSASASVQFTAHLDSSIAAVNWSLSGAGCTGASCGSLSTSGFYTAPAVVGSGFLVTVTAALQSDATKKASAGVSVRGSNSGGLTITPATASVVAGGLQLFSASNCPLSNIDIFCSFKLMGPGCSGASCGTLIGGAFSRMYQAPLIVPSPPTVTVSLYSVFGGHVNAAVNLLRASDALLSGNFVFLIEGKDASGPITAAGLFAADGAGHISGGTLDILRSGGMISSPILGGSYNVGTDLRGSLSLQTAQGTRSYKLAVNPAGSARLLESDATGTLASGTLKKQSAGTLDAAILTGNFALGLSGNAADDTRAALAGAFQADGQGILASGLMDANVDGASSASVTWQGTYAVNSAGRVTISFSASLLGTSGQLNLAGYIVSNQELVLIGSDTASSPHLLSGWARGQSNTSFPADIYMVAALSGVSGSGTSALAANLFGPNPAQAYVTQNIAGSSHIAVPANWSYTLGTQGRGTMTLQSSPSHSFVFYLYGDQSGFVLEDSGTGVQSGEMFPGLSLSFGGSYRLGTQSSSGTQSALSGSLEGPDCSMISGLVDTSSSGSTLTGQTFAGTCAPDPNNQVLVFSITQPSNLTWVLHEASLKRAVAVPVTPGDSSPSLIFIEK